VAFIDAEVLEAVSRVPVTAADLRAEDLEVLHEYRHFLERTRLDEIRPDQRIRFTIAGGYDHLIEHIAMHRYFIQVEWGREVGEEQAVAHWYDTVYMPVIEAIRTHKVLVDFPHRTESDLYLWIVQHLYYLQEKEEDVSIEEAAADYADQFSERPLKKIVRSVKQALEGGETRSDSAAQKPNDTEAESDVPS
jgi:hypothetical protein